MNNIFVVKRNNSKELLQIQKIQKQTSDATKGLDNVSQSELEVDAKLQFKDGVTTAEIQETLIKTAVDKIDLDTPNWTYVGARLFLYDLYHRVNGFAGYKRLRDYLDRGIKEGKILDGFSNKFDLDLLNSYIKPERDLEFTYLGVKTLYDRYLLKDKEGRPIELPQHMFMGIAMFLSHKEKDCNKWAIEFYELLSQFKIMASTPTLSNARTTRHQLSSCYIGSMPDNVEGIFDSYKEMALLSKYGGGIGYDVTKIRSIGSSIDHHKNASGGVVPFLKITNDIAVAVDQLGTRKGAIATYLEIWHLDVFDFIDLRKNSGEERRRTHDLFPALWICDLFMKRVKENGLWTLFDPFEVSELTNLYGEEFEKRYIELESNDAITKETIQAKDLWKKILTNYFESGLPFLAFKDTANKTNPNSHTGLIRSSNLCTEIFQNTNPSHYVVEIEYMDKTKEIFEENDIITTDNGITKKANKITSLDKINGKEVFISQKKGRDGDTAVCNLASVNLSKVNTKEEIEKVIPIAIRMLDNVIDLNFYPNRKVKATNIKTRAIGLGVMGEAEYLASNFIKWGSNEHLEAIDIIMECISFNAIKASSNLAKEKGVYKEFKGSKWSKGIFPIDTANINAKNLLNRSLIYDWDSLRKEVIDNGMRNGYLMAIAPTSSISILTGTTQTIEPIYRKRWYEENMSGLIPVIVPNLTLDTFNYYVSAYDLDQLDLIKAGAVRQKWIDQGQSLNIFMDISKASGRYLNDIYMMAWELGIKSTYYLRSQSPEAEKETNKVADRSIECHNCQ